MEFEKKRWISLIAGIILNLLAGVSYAWSVFVLPLNEKYGWSMSKLAIAYTMLSVTMLIANMTVIPHLRRRFSLRTILIIGGIFYGGGVAISGYVSNIWMFYLLYSVVAGIGNSMIYPVLIAYSQQSFPERPGFASGLMAAGLGLGSVVLATVANMLFNITGDVSKAMMIMGAAFMAGIIIAAMFVYEVPAGFDAYIKEKATARSQTVPAAQAAEGRPASEAASASQRAASEAASAAQHPVSETASSYLYEKNRKEMLRDPLFYMLYPCIILGAICGTMIITQGSPIMQKTFMTSPETAALVVSIFSIANTVGRPIWGKISDKIGRLQSFIGLHAIMAVSMAVLFMCKVQIIFVMALMFAMLCFGGIATMVAPITADFWGTRHITENYGVTFSVFGISSLVGAPLIANILESTGKYDMAFLAGLIMAAVGLALAVILLRKTEKIRRSLS